MATRSRIKQVSFFEIRDADGQPLDDLIPWQEHLADLAKEPAAKRMHILHGVQHWGQAYLRGLTLAWISVYGWGPWWIRPCCARVPVPGPRGSGRGWCCGAY